MCGESKASECVNKVLPVILQRGEQPTEQSISVQNKPTYPGSRPNQWQRLLLLLVVRRLALGERSAMDGFAGLANIELAVATPKALQSNGHE